VDSRTALSVYLALYACMCCALVYSLLLHLCLYNTTAIGTWYKAFTARTQQGEVPPAYRAIRYLSNDINNTKFKRDLGNGGRSIRQVRQTFYTSICCIICNVGIIW